MNPRVTKILWTAAALLLLAPLAGCKGKAADPKTATAAVVLTVQAAPAAEGTVLDTVEVLGEFQGREEIRVFATVPDRIRELLVKEGDRVKAGDVLLTVWNDLQGGAVAQAQAGQAAASVGAKAAHDNLVRMRKLAADGVIPPAQLEAAEAQANAAAAQVRAASTGVGMAGLQKDRTVVRAPIDGVVTSLAVKAGDMAGAGMPLLTLVQPDRLKAVLKVPERSFLKLTQGMPVTLSPVARPDLTRAAQVTLKGPIVDRMTKTGQIEAEFDNADGKFVPGSTARAVFELGRRDRVVLVPPEALQLTANTELTREATLFVTDGKVARERKVKIGARQPGQIEITEGLKAGERIVVVGAYLLRDGAQVRIEEARR